MTINFGIHFIPGHIVVHYIYCEKARTAGLIDVGIGYIAVTVTMQRRLPPTQGINDAHSCIHIVPHETNPTLSPVDISMSRRPRFIIVGRL